MQDRVGQGQARGAGRTAARYSRRAAVGRGALATATAGAALLAARTHPHAAAQEATPAATPSGPPTGSTQALDPAHVAAAVERAPEIARDLLGRTGMPGMAVAIVETNAALLVEGFGVRELGEPEPIDGDTVFQIASVSKSVASTVVAAVVGEGVVSWSSRLSDIDPGFALKQAYPTQEVTIADLFSHRSGLRDHAGDLLEDVGYDRGEVLHRLRFLDPDYPFRAGYEYTNFGLTAAAVAAAHAAGTDWETLSDNRLYAPLGMASTSSRFADFMARTDRAVPHVLRDGIWSVTPQQRDPDAQSPAGGVSSTASDLSRWARLQLGSGEFEGQRIVDAAALGETWIPHAVRGAVADAATQIPPFYGLGWNVNYTPEGLVQVGHSGAFALGTGTAVYLLPGAGFGVLALANGSPIGVPEAFCLSVMEIARTGELTTDWMTVIAPAFVDMDKPTYGTGIDYAEPPADAAPPRALSAYAGTFTNDFYGDVVIAEAGAGLELRIGPEPQVFPMTHYDADVWSYQPAGENAYGRTGVVFTIGANDEAMAIWVGYLATGGPGELRRVDAG